jgi:CRP/FNR family transcriptional regulator, cyclic AMP receptor protein
MAPDSTEREDDAPCQGSAMGRRLRILKAIAAFDAEAFLRSAVRGNIAATYRPGETIFTQGDISDSVMYVREGFVKLSVLSPSGKEAIVAMLEPGAFFGESALAGRPVRQEVATAVTLTTVLVIPKQQMIRLLHEQHGLSDRFITHMLARNIRIEEDLVDQLFNSCEKRLARTLLLLAHYGTPGKSRREVLRISQQTLAEMVGTTRPRVNAFMNEFRKLGFIEYRSGCLTVKDALLTVILRDERHKDTDSEAS